MKSYSQDLRKRIIHARQQGAGAEEAAKRFDVCKRTVERYWKRFSQTGNALNSRAAAEVKTAREQWREEQPSLSAKRLVFIDETALNTKMARLRGRSPRGQRCVGRVPHGHYQTCTAIAALRHDRLCAPFVIDGAMNGEMFIAYLQKELLPELSPGDVVICDNLSSHKNAAVKKLLEAHGCQLRYLPAYSPDLNPIEQAFAKLKSDVRSASAREYGPLLKAIAHSVRSFTPQLCKNLFAHANYATN